MQTLIVVNGGDAPGINTFIARYLTIASMAGDTVWGSRAGFEGALRGEVLQLASADVVPFAGMGGSVLSISHSTNIAMEAARKKLLHVLHTYQIDNMLILGGGGTLSYIVPMVHQWGVSVIGIPTTIYNNIAGTDRTLGFDSACNFAYYTIDGSLATARALPSQIYMIETHSGATGYLPLEIALGSGAHAVLLPEYEMDAEQLAQHTRYAINKDGYALIVVGDGVLNVDCDALAKMTGVAVQQTRLGYGQQGAVVSHIDRRLAFDMALKAFEGFNSGVGLGIVLVRGEHVLLYEDRIDHFELSPPNYDQYALVNGLKT